MFDRSKLESLRDSRVTRIGDTFRTVGFYDLNAAMILERTDYLFDCFVSSYSISITRSPSSACYFTLPSRNY